MAAVAAQLAEFGSRPGKVAILREPPAQHYERGAYSVARAGWTSATRGCCKRISQREAYDNYNWRAAHAAWAAAAAHPSVHMLPWYNATLRRDGAHVGTRARCFERRAGGGWLRRKECACDCTHFCYTPLFYDSTFLTPLHRILSNSPVRRATPAQRSAVARLWG